MSAPTDHERDLARAAALALRAAIADPATMGEIQSTHVYYTTRHGEWVDTWSNLPGFVRASGPVYRHVLLPGWQYTRAEIRTEMIPDLEALAERGERPTEATRP